MERTRFSFFLLLIVSIFILSLPVISSDLDMKSSVPTERISSLHKANMATSEGIVDNGDGTYTFTQVIDEQSTPPHYDASASAGGFEIYSWWDEDYGWMHTFTDWNTPGLNILSAKMTILAWDVDSEPVHGYDGEYDGVHVDGILLSPGYLQGSTGTWSETSFDIPVGAIIDDGDINVWLDIDMHHQEDTWATTLDYSLLEITFMFSSNNSPFKPVLSLSPSETCAGDLDDLVVSVVGPTPADPDGDAVSYLYRWFVDVGTGGFIDDEFAGRGDHPDAVVPAEDTQVGDIWQVIVTPKDANGIIGPYAIAVFPEISEGKCLPSPFDSDINVGLAPVVVHFMPLYEMPEYHWWLDLNVHAEGDEQCYAYWLPQPPTQKEFYDVRLNDFNFEDFIRVYPAAGLGHLKVVDSSPGLKDTGWDNAIDGDLFWTNGAALVTNDENGVWAIFSFTDESVRKINKVRLMSDVGLGNLELHARSIRVMTSATNTAPGSFSPLIEASDMLCTDTPLVLNDDWKEWDVAPTRAKYIKLIVDQPEHVKWRQIGEFQVWFETTMADAVNSGIVVDGNLTPDIEEQVPVKLLINDENGKPLTNLTEHDIKFFSKQIYGFEGIENECTDADIFGELKNLGGGSYATTFMSTTPGQKLLLASVNGVVIDSGAEVNVAPEYEDDGEDCDVANALVFVNGSDTYKKGADDRSWNNAVDGDVDGWDGTTLTRGTGDPEGPAWGIFKFCDDGVYKFNNVMIITDNGTDDDCESYFQATQFEIWTSTKTSALSDFDLAMKIDRRGDGTEHWYKSSDYIHAKYVMLKLTRPTWYPGGWRQIVELELHTESKQGPQPSELFSGVAPEGVMNYPNPLNPTTQILYNLPQDCFVTLKVYDISGRQVATLVNSKQSAGNHRIEWDGSNYASGIYFYKLTAGQQTFVKRMTLLK